MKAPVKVVKYSLIGIFDPLFFCDLLQIEKNVLTKPIMRCIIYKLSYRKAAKVHRNRAAKCRRKSLQGFFVSARRNSVW